jgi:hypothetical protein
MDTTMETDMDMFGFVSPAISLFTGRHICYWVSLSHWRSCKKISKVAGELEPSSLKLPDHSPASFSKAAEKSKYMYVHCPGRFTKAGSSSYEAFQNPLAAPKQL